MDIPEFTPEEISEILANASPVRPRITLSPLPEPVPPDETVQPSDTEDTGPIEDGAEVLDALTAYFQRFVHFTFPEQADSVALWTMYTHCFGQKQPYSYVPYLIATSAEPLSGKTTMLDLIAKVCHKPMRGEMMSPALLGREVGGKTLLLDEIDGVYKGKTTDSDGMAMDLRTILNGGFGKDGAYHRLVRDKDNAFVAHAWSTFGPKAMAGIGRTIPDTVKSRSIRLRLQRKDAETTVEKARDRIVSQVSEPLLARMSRLAKQIGELPFIESFEGELGEMGHRDQDIWEPLIAMADACGGEWSLKARRAAVLLAKSEPYQSNGVRLLSDIRDIFEAEDWPEHLNTADIIGTAGNSERGEFAVTPKGLCAVDDFGWAAWNHGRPITPHTLARLMGEFDIKSARKPLGNHRYGSKGYFLADLQDAWVRYLTPEEDEAEES